MQAAERLNEFDQRWDEWEFTRARLQIIESSAKQMKRHAGLIHDMLEKMTERPDFETRAQDELQQTLKDVAVLHAFLKASTEHYERLPATA